MKLSRRQSWCLFLMAAAMSLVWAYAVHHFAPRHEPDSRGYLDYDWSSVRAVLENYRTFAYPLFLKLVQWISADPRAIPLAHSLALVLAAFLVLEGLVATGYRRHTALWCAVTLLWGSGVLKLGPIVVADSLACSLAIAAAGCFLATTAAPTRRWGWCGLVLLTLLAYQTRPSYLFLIPLWPLVSVAADRLILRRDANWASILHRGGIYACATVVPFVLFCSLRWSVVGHWGLVSFGGNNLIGVVGQFLDPDDIDSLPADLQPVAQGMLDRRKQLPDYVPPTSFLAMEQAFNPTVWDLAVPATHDRYGENQIVVNRLLGQFSGELLVRHPWEYLRWLIGNASHALKQAILLTATDHGTALVYLLLVAYQGLSLWRGPTADDQAVIPPGEQSLAEIRFRERQLLFWAAIAFLAAKSLLVILVEPANDRYMTGAIPLVPAALAVFAVQLWERLPRTGPRPRGSCRSVIVS